MADESIEGASIEGELVEKESVEGKSVDFKECLYSLSSKRVNRVSY